MNKEIDVILSRYFSGEASPKELRSLDAWLSQSDENEKYFHQMTSLYQYTGQSDNTPSFNTENAFVRFKDYMYQDLQNVKTSKFKTHSRKNFAVFYRAAAVVTLLAVATFTLYYFINQSTQTIKLMAGENNKERTLFNGTADLTLFAGSEITYSKDPSDLITLKGKATFNVRSKMSEGITVKAGEVYVKDIGTIFTVDASKSKQYITVQVDEGEVWFYADINNGIQIKADEAAAYDVKTKQFKMLPKKSKKPSSEMPEIQELPKTPTTPKAPKAPEVQNSQDTPHEMSETQKAATAQKPQDTPKKAQKTQKSKESKKSNNVVVLNELVFKDTPLQEAIDAIKARYGVDINIVSTSNVQNKILLNASFDKNESVEYVLEIIAETISAKLSKQGNTYIITI